MILIFGWLLLTMLFLNGYTLEAKICFSRRVEVDGECGASGFWFRVSPSSPHEIVDTQLSQPGQMNL